MSQQDTQNQNREVPTTPSSQEFGEITSSASAVEKDELNVIDENSALAQETGSTGKSKRDIAEDAIHEHLSELIYSSDEAFPREYNQNAETAVIRAAKLLISHHPDYGEEWLTRDVTTEDGRTIELPRPLSEIMEAASSLGYNPTIEVELHRDERKIVYQDPGIGMTAHELDKAFNTTGMSGVSYDADTGGKMGLGALTFVKPAGKYGDITGWTKTRKVDAPDIDKEGIAFLTDLSGLEEIPNDIPENFRGTRFEIPVLEESEGGIDLNKFQDWLAKYSQALRVPLLYKEYRDGETITEEEYGGNTLEELYNDPPIVVNRPGEYTIVAGPDVPNNYGDPDCFLVSMPIERNTRVSVRSLWNVKVQIHNEQGLIVEGPNRGMKEENVDLHEDDVPLPQPTADRDRLQKDTANTRFFKHIKEVVKKRELEVAAEFLDHIDGPEDVLSAPQDNPGEWKTFRKVLKRHGPHGVFNNLKRFTRFLQKEDNKFRTYDDDVGMTISEWEYRCQCIKKYTDDDPIEVIGSYDIPETYQKIHGLFTEFSHAPRNGYNVSRQKGRSEKKLGDLLADSTGSNIYMAASTGGKFMDRAKTLWNTYDDSEIIVVSGAHKYETYEDLYGFKRLPNVPYRRDDDEDDEWDIPDAIASKNKRSDGTDKKSRGKPDDVEDHVLKIRTESGHKIDARYPVKKVRERFSGDGNGIHRRSELVLFPRSGERNISDNYDFADHAAIASCSNEEYEALKDCAAVFLPDEYKARSYNSVIATEDGAMTLPELIEDDRLVILAMVNDIEGKKLITDERAEMREYFTEDLLSQQNRDEKPDVLWAVADRKAMNKIEFVADQEYVGRKSLIAFKYGRLHSKKFNSYSLKKGESHYQRLIDTPNWDDDSEIYNVIDSLTHNKGYKGHVEELMMALHDLNMDFTKMEEDDVREKVALLGYGDSNA